MAPCYGSSFILEITWGTTGTFCIFLWVNVSKQLCVHGQWIHMQGTYEVNILITFIFWFNPAGSIYVKISQWHSCPQLCLLSNNSRHQIWVYNNCIFLPGHISSINSKWYLCTLETYQLNSGSWLWHIHNIVMGRVMAEWSMLIITWMFVICAWYMYVHTYVHTYVHAL